MDNCCTKSSFTKLFFKFTFSLIAVSLFFASTAYSAASQSKEDQLLTVGFTTSSYMYKQSGEIRGPLAKIHQCIFKDFNNVIYVDVATPDRLMMMLDANRLDIGVLLDRSDQRDKFASFVTDYIGSSVIEVSREQTPDRRKVLGLRLGTNLTGYLEQIQTSEVVYTKTLPQLIEMFERGRLSHFIEVAPLIKDYLSTKSNLVIKEIGKGDIGMYSTFQLLNTTPHIIELLDKSAKDCVKQLPESFRP